MASFTRQQLESWLKTIKVKGGRILDIGGSQNPLSKSRLAIFEPDEYKILDLEQPHECKQAPDIIMDLNNENGSFSVNVEDERDENGKILNYKKSDVNVRFDIAFCLEVSEYWWNPFRALKNINCFLKEGGLLYLSFHFAYPVHNPIKQDYLRYTLEGVNKLLEETGFEILEMKPRLFKNKEGWANFYMREGMRPAKEYDKHGWQGCLIQAKKL